ncbi:MAG: CBS domain-containing protein [Gammaproteobacteria bacterium]|nr:CBS domain-containing protein [Gammaproteobacteria bacterium]MDH5591979.1 CBS domain-containing protein [Gammaproteobacteria bacterium]
MTEQDFAHIFVSEWLSLHPETPVVVAGKTPMREVALTLLANNSRDAYIVDENNKVLGHLSFGKMTNHLLSEHRPIHTHRQLFARVTDPTAEEVMDPHFAYARCDESLCEVIHRQLERDVDTLVVLAEDNTLLGSVSLRDLVAESLK